MTARKVPSPSVELNFPNMMARTNSLFNVWLHCGRWELYSWENSATSFIEKGDDADPTMSELRMIIEPTRSEEAALAQGEGDSTEPEGGRYPGGLDRPDGVAERNHVAYKALSKSG